MKKHSITILYNSPVILTFALLSLLALGLGKLTDGWTTQNLFCVYRSSLTDWLTYPRFFLHVLGHPDFAAYCGNIVMLLVVGPTAEERFGGKRILLAIALTALVTGLVLWFFFPNGALMALEDQLHIFFQQKKTLLTKKKEYDFAELDFLVQTRIDADIRARFQEAYAVWRDNIRAIIILFCPNMEETDKELIPYMAVSLLEGASIQVLVDGKGFDADSYFAYAEDMVLRQIRIAMEKKEG